MSNKIILKIGGSFEVMLTPNNEKNSFWLFVCLCFFDKKEKKSFEVIKNLFEFIDFIEILKSFSNNRLDTEKIYKIGNVFTAKIAQKNKKISLEIRFRYFDESLFLDKFECSSLSAKLSKILQKCEIWQEQEA